MLFPNAFTDTIKEQYWSFKKSFKSRNKVYAYNDVLFIKGVPGSGKTTGALNYCQIYPSTLYFSFASLDAVIAPKVFAGRYPDIFTACANWDVFFDQLLNYGIKTRCTIFFDDAALRNDKDKFFEQLQRVLEQNQEFSFFVVFLLKPWETLPLRAHTKTLLPMSPASLRRTMGLKDEDTFRLFTLTDGNPHLIGQYNSASQFTLRILSIVIAAAEHGNVSGIH